MHALTLHRYDSRRTRHRERVVKRSSSPGQCSASTLMQTVDHSWIANAAEQDRQRVPCSTVEGSRRLPKIDYTLLWSLFCSSPTVYYHDGISWQSGDGVDRRGPRAWLTRRERKNPRKAKGSMPTPRDTKRLPGSRLVDDYAVRYRGVNWPSLCWKRLRTSADLAGPTSYASVNLLKLHNAVSISFRPCLRVSSPLLHALHKATTTAAPAPLFRQPRRSPGPRPLNRWYKAQKSWTRP